MHILENIYFEITNYVLHVKLPSLSRLIRLAIILIVLTLIIGGSMRNDQEAKAADSVGGLQQSQETAFGRWESLGLGLNASVRAIAISGSDVYVGGDFTDAGGNPDADHIARWDGSEWHALGSGLSSVAFAIAISGNDVYVGGNFTDAGGHSGADYIARWDGTEWHELGSGLSGSAYAIAVNDSDVYVGGSFYHAGGIPDTENIARWDGSEWHALGSGLSDQVYTIDASGSDVYAGGEYIYIWDGANWNPLGSGLSSWVYSIVVDDGEVYVGGEFKNAGGNPDADKIALWDGTSWNALGTGLSSGVTSIVVRYKNVFAGGSYQEFGSGADGDYIAYWDGGSWSPLGSGMNSYIQAVAARGSDLFMGGLFTNAGGNPNADHIVKYGPVGIKSYLPIVMSCEDLIVNGGFENNGGWEIPATEYSAGYSTSNFHTGARSMRTGIIKTSHNKYSYSSFRQEVSIPANAKATLTTYLYRLSDEPDATNITPPQNWFEANLGEGSLPEEFSIQSGDVQYVLILNEGQEWIESLIWQRKDAPEWTRKVFDLSKYAGKTIWIQFGTYNDGHGGVTSMHVDDVSLVICP